MPGWLGFVWTLPNTALGALLGALTFQLPRAADGVLIFDRAPRGVTWLLPKFDRGAMTVGHVILSATPVQGTLFAHELHHVRQYDRLGPFFIPVYFLLAARYGYRRHPMERAAQRAAHEIDA